jgi:hypothetical protein
MTNKLKRMWKKAVVTWFKVQSWNLFRGTEQDHENLSKYSQFQGLDLNTVSPEYEAGMLTTRPWYSVDTGTETCSFYLSICFDANVMTVTWQYQAATESDRQVSQRCTYVSVLCVFMLLFWWQVSNTLSGVVVRYVVFKNHKMQPYLETLSL